MGSSDRNYLQSGDRRVLMCSVNRISVFLKKLYLIVVLTLLDRSLAAKCFDILLDLDISLQFVIIEYFSTK